MPAKFNNANRSSKSRTNANNNRYNNGQSNNRQNGFRPHNTRNNTEFRFKSSNQSDIPKPTSAAPVKPWYAGENDLPPPKQPKIAFNSQQLFNYVNFLTGKNDYETIHRLIRQMVLLRRSIMSIWKDDNEEIDVELLSNIPRCNIQNPIFTLPKHFQVSISLPSTTNKFNNYVWAVMYHAMFPLLMPIKFTEASMNAYAWTFHEFLAATKTASRSIVLEGLISEERVKLNKRIHNKHSPEYISELKAIRLRHGDELRTKMKDLRTFYEEYVKNITTNATAETVNPETNPLMKNIWERITFNPIICGIDEYAKPIINSSNYKILFLEFVDRYKIEDYQTIITALRNKFYSEYPDYTNADMYDIDETSPEITKLYEAKAAVIQAQLDKEEDARVAAAIAKRQAEDEEWYRNHPNWEEEEEEWNEEEPVEEDIDSDANQIDECERRNQYIPLDVDAKLKAEAKEEYISNHAAEIAKRHSEHEVIYNKWIVINKYIEILNGLAHFKMQLEDLNRTNQPLDDSKVDYNVDHYDPTVRYDSHEEQMEKSRLSLVLNFYSLYDSIMDACAEPFRPYPKIERFNDPVRSQYNRIHLESIDGPARVQLSFNSVEPGNINTLTFLFKSLYNIENILPKCITSGIAASASESMAHAVAMFIKSLTSNYARVTELLLQPKILNDTTVIRNRNFWFFFWSLYFNDVVVITQTPAQLLSTLLSQCGNANNQGACFVTFRLVTAYNKANNINDHARFELIKGTMFTQGLPLLHTFKLDNYYAVIDALELIDQFQLAQYRKTNNLK